MTAHLRVIECDDNGQVIEPTCKDCLRRVDEIAGLERIIRSQAAQIQALLRDKAAEAREHPLWPVAGAICREWRKLCRHPRSPLTPDRFWQIEPFLTGPTYGDTLEARILLCRLAIAGAAYDCWTTRRRNGTAQRHDQWYDVFHRKDGKAKADGFEEFCNKAPKGWTPGAPIDAGESWTFEDVERAMKARRA